MPHARFHDLRHTYAMLSLQNGDDVKTVQHNVVMLLQLLPWMFMVTSPRKCRKKVPAACKTSSKTLIPQQKPIVVKIMVNQQKK